MGLRPIGYEDLQWSEAKYPSLTIRSWSESARTIIVQGFTKYAPFSFKHTTNSDRSQAIESWRIPDIPTFCNAYVVPAGIRRGYLYCEVSLSIGTNQPLRLFAGYITDTHYLNWPYGRYEHSVEGPGRLVSVAGTNPAAGVEISQAVPLNTRWQLLAVRFDLVTSGTAADRRVVLYVDDGTTELIRIPAPATQAASLTYKYSWSPLGLDSAARDDTILCALPNPLPLLQGWRIRTSTVNLQTGDDYGVPQLMVQEWIEE